MIRHNFNKHYLRGVAESVIINPSVDCHWAGSEKALSSILNYVKSSVFKIVFRMHGALFGIVLITSNRFSLR